MSLPALYTAEETATKLKVTRRAVYRWLSTGKLKGLRIGQHWRIAEEELMEFMSYGNSYSPAIPKVLDNKLKHSMKADVLKENGKHETHE